MKLQFGPLLIVSAVLSTPLAWSQAGIRPGYACFAGRAEAARTHAHRATELEVDSRYDACEPGYASFIEALCEVYCGNLDRYVELTGTVVQRYGRQRGYGLASYVDGLQSSGRVNEAVALAEESVATARELGNPYWISYALWIAGLAFSKADAQRALAGWTRASRSCGSTASSSSRASSLATRPGCILLPETPRPRWCSSPKPSPRSTGSATSRSWSSPWPVCRRSSNTSTAWSRRRCCSLPYPASPRALTTSRNSATWAAGSPAGSREAGGRALARRSIARSQRDRPVRAAADRSRPPEPDSPPGAARGPEPPGDRGAAPRRRRPDRTGDRGATFHLVANGRTPHSARYTKIGVSGRAAATRWAVKHDVVDAAGR